MAESGTDDRFGNMERALWVLTAFRADPASSIEGDWFGTEILRFVSADDAAMALGSLINGLLQTSSVLIDALAEEFGPSRRRGNRPPLAQNRESQRR